MNDSRSRLESHRVTHSTSPMADQTPHLGASSTGLGNTVIPIFVLALLIPLRDLPVLLPIPTPLPLNTLAAIMLVFIAAFIRPRWSIGLPTVTWSAGALLFSLIVPSILMQEDFNVRRAGSIGVLFLLVYVVGSGRLHLDSLRRGLLAGLVIGVVIDGLRISGSGYEGRLSGVLSDPNGAGFILVVLGLVVAQRITRRRNLIALWAFLAASIWLTQSRTSMFAFTIASLWILAGRRIGRLTGIAVLAGVTWLFQWASEFAEAQGWFVERLGSDNLRDRLAEVERVLTDTAGWWGHGLGTAIAEFDGITLFFHNSYRALQTEGGLVALLLLIILGIALYWTFPSLPHDSRPVWAEGALIAACICSINIGYSLTSVPMAMAVGMYLAYHCQAREELQPEADAHVR